MGLKEAYFAVEDRYYEFCDWLEAKGVPIYRFFVDPIENTGMPSFPFFVLILALVIGGAGFLVLSFLQPATTSVNVAVFSGETPLDGVPVTLLIEGEAPRTAVSENGVARFDNVPVGKTGVVRIEQEGFESFVQTISIEPEKEVAASLQTVAPPEVKKERVLVKVADESGVGIPDATIYFESEMITTGPDGKAFFEADPTQIYSVKVEKDGYETADRTVFGSSKQTIIKLSPKKNDPVDEGGAQEQYGDISVYVKNEQGEPVEATATLYNAEFGSPVLSDRTNEHGSVFWKEAAAVGTLVYVNVEPVDEAYAPYDGINDVQEVSGIGETEFRITVKRKAPEEFGKITITVLDEDGNPVEGAEVKMFLQGTSRQAPGDSSQFTESDGKAVFEVATGTVVYITAWADGYLPGILKELAAGDDKQIKLTKAILGNNGDAQVNVVDADANPVAGATVELVYADGFNTGIPLTTTDSLGAASFTALPLTELFVANAVYGSLKGRSDAFSPVLGEVASVTVALEPTYGNIVVLAKDATNNAPIPAISAAARYPDGEEVANCTATVAGTCQLRVRANKEVIVSVEARNYAPQETERLVVSTGETLTKTVSLLPAGLVNNLTVIDFHLENYDGTPVQGNQVAKGGFYWVKFTANLPTSDNAGLFVSVGDKATVDEDVAAITFIQQPSSAAAPPASLLNPQVTFSSAFNPGPNCANDLAIQKEQWKWVNFNYKNYSGRPTMSLLVFVKPTATEKDKLTIRYRAYAGKGRVWVRTPKDEELGDRERTAAKDSCYAEAFVKEYRIVEGAGACDANACMSLAFASFTEPETRTGSGFTIGVNQQLIAYFEVRPFVTLTSPYIKITSPEKEVLFTQYQIGTGPPVPVPAGLEFADSNKIMLQSFTTGRIAVTLDAGQTLLGNALATTVFQNSFSKIRLEFGDARGVIKVLEVPIVIQGTGTLNLAVDPATIYIGQNQQITATVTTTAAGQLVPITDAKVWLREGDGNPFNGNTYQNSPLTGDGTRDNGENGEYVFTKVSPVYNGSLVVEAERKGFATAQALVNVNAENFLQFEPDETTGLQYAAEACNKSQTFKIINPLDTTVPVNISVTGREGQECLKLTGPAGLLCARGYCTVTLPKKKAAAFSAKLVDKFAQTCDIVVNTRFDPPGGVAATHVYPVTIDCRPAAAAFGPPCRTYNDCEYQADCVCIDPNQGAQRPGGKGFDIGRPYPAGGRGEPTAPEDQWITRDGARIPTSVADGDIPGAECGPGGCECQTPEGEANGYCDCITGFENYYTMHFGELWFHYEWASRTGDLWRLFTKDKSETMADKATGVILEGSGLEMKGIGTAEKPVQLRISPLLPYDAFTLSVITRGEEFTVSQKGLGKGSCFLLRDIEGILFGGPKSKKEWVTDISPSALKNKTGEHYTVVFNPDCPDLKTEFRDEKFSMMFTDGTSKVMTKEYIITFQVGTTKKNVHVNVSIESPESRLAFLFVPTPNKIGDAVIAVRKLKEKTSKEPLWVVNNIQDPLGILPETTKFKNLLTDAKSEAEIKDDTKTITFAKVSGKEVNTPEDKLSIKTPSPTPDAIKELLKYDVIGNVFTEQGDKSKICSDVGYCVTADWSTWNAEIQKLAGEETKALARENKVQKGAVANLFTWSGVLKFVASEVMRYYLAMGPALWDTARELCCNPEASQCVFGTIPPITGAPPTFKPGGVPVASQPPTTYPYPGAAYGPYVGYGVPPGPPTAVGGPWGAAGGVYGAYGPYGAPVQVNAMQCIQFAIRSLCTIGKVGMYRAGRRYAERTGLLSEGIGGLRGSSGLVGAGRRLGFCTLLANSVLLLADMVAKMDCFKYQFDYERILDAFTEEDIIPLMKQIRAAMKVEKTSNTLIFEFTPEIKAVGKKAGENGGIKVLTCTSGKCDEEHASQAGFRVEIPIIGPLFGRAEPGYPYVDCTGQSCAIAFDEGKPVLATLNKYKAGAVESDELGLLDTIKTASPNNDKIADKNEVSVESCKVTWTCEHKKAADQSFTTVNQEVVLDPNDFVFKCTPVTQGADGACGLTKTKPFLYSNNQEQICKLAAPEIVSAADEILKAANTLVELNDARFKDAAVAVKNNASELNKALSQKSCSNKIDNALRLGAQLQGASKVLEDKWREEYNKWKQELREARKKVDDLENEVDKLQNELDELRKEKQSRETLQREIDALENKINDLKTSMANRDKIIQEKTSLASTLNQQLSQLKPPTVQQLQQGTGFFQYSIKFDEIKKEIDEVDEAREKLYEEWKRMAAEKSALEGQLNGKKARLDELEGRQASKQILVAINEKQLTLQSKQTDLDEARNAVTLKKNAKPTGTDQIEDIQCTANGVGWFCTKRGNLPGLLENLAKAKQDSGNTPSDINEINAANEAKAEIKMIVTGPWFGKPVLRAVAKKALTVKVEGNKVTVSQTSDSDFKERIDALLNVTKYFYNESYVPDSDAFAKQLNDFALAVPSEREVTIKQPGVQ